LPYAVYHREGEWACRILSSAAGPVGWPASFPRARVGAAPGVLATAKWKTITRCYMNGITATANLRKRRTLFLRKLWNSYGWTQFLRTFATENGDTATEERKRNAGNHAWESEGGTAGVGLTYHQTQ